MLGIHQSAFPAGDGDIGYGAPAAAAGCRLVGFARSLGFNAVALGPDGQISDANPSPYDSAAFSRNVLTLDVRGLSEADGERLLSARDMDAVFEAAGPATDPTRADPRRARRAVSVALTRAAERLADEERRHSASVTLDELEAFRSHQASWLERDAFFEVLSERVGHDDPTRFDPALPALLSPTAVGKERRRSMRAVIRAAIERIELSQLLVHRQTIAFRAHANREGMFVFGDLPIGWSHRDRFLHADAFTDRWLLGAPPSRTNPDGQPWAYPVLHPDQLDDADSPARRLFSRRVRHLLDYYDGLRVDHPHGLVCPWIYSAAAPRSTDAVRHGTRAFSSPDRGDADLSRWAIVDRSALDPQAGSRWAEDWVRTLTQAQVRRYARLFDELAEIVVEHGSGLDHVAAEVLSTCPMPLRRVLERHGLGRFRVTQKVNVADPVDPYRADLARPADWVMLGTHDTEPIFAVARRWISEESAAPRARYLADRLVPDAARRRDRAARFASSTASLAEALLADLFVSEARNVFVYFTDLFGETEPFNRAGVVHPDNWTLRVPPDFETVYEERRARGAALDIRAAVRLALEARQASGDLIRALS